MEEDEEEDPVDLMETLMGNAKEVEAGPQAKKKRTKTKPPSDLGQQIGGSDAVLAQYLVNSTRIQEEMLKRINQPDAPKATKRSRENECEELEGDLEDKSWQVVEESHTVTDNGVDAFYWPLRTKFRPPNSSPSEWWKSGSFESRQSLPRRANTLYLEHITGGQR